MEMPAQDFSLCLFLIPEQVVWIYGIYKFKNMNKDDII